MNKNMIACKTCGQEIAKNAKNCPHCGAKIKKLSPVLIVAVVVIAIIIVATSGNNEPTLVESGNNASTQTTTAEATKNEFQVGDTAALNDVNVCLVEVTESNGSQYNQPNDGNVFVLCEFEIANNSDEEITVSSIMSFEAYCDDYACTFSLTALMEKGNKNQLDGTVAPGKKFNGVIGYEVPADWQKLEVHYTPDFFNGKDIVFVANNG